MSLARVHNFAISLDGFGTGEGQSRDALSVTPASGCTNGCSPPGGGSATSGGAAASTTPSPSSTIRGSAPRSWAPGSSARPAGTRTRSGRARGVPTRRSTHRSSSSPITRARRSRWRAARRSTSSTPRPPRRSRRPARPRRQGRTHRRRSPPMIRDFLAAGLVDHMHTVVVPILLGRGVRLWDGLEGLEKDYEVEATSSPSGVTHVTFTRAGAEAELASLCDREDPPGRLEFAEARFPGLALHLDRGPRKQVRGSEAARRSRAPLARHRVRANRACGRSKACVPRARSAGSARSSTGGHRPFRRLALEPRTALGRRPCAVARRPTPTRSRSSVATAATVGAVVVVVRRRTARPCRARTAPSLAGAARDRGELAGGGLVDEHGLAQHRQVLDTVGVDVGRADDVRAAVRGDAAHQERDDVQALPGREVVADDDGDLRVEVGDGHGAEASAPVTGCRAMSDGIPIHVDDVPEQRWEVGELDATRKRLGAAANALPHGRRDHRDRARRAQHARARARRRGRGVPRPGGLRGQLAVVGLQGRARVRDRRRRRAAAPRPGRRAHADRRRRGADGARGRRGLAHAPDLAAAREAVLGRAALVAGATCRRRSPPTPQLGPLEMPGAHAPSARRRSATWPTCRCTRAATGTPPTPPATRATWAPSGSCSPTTRCRRTRGTPTCTSTPRARSAGTCAAAAGSRGSAPTRTSCAPARSGCGAPNGGVGHRIEVGPEGMDLITMGDLVPADVVAYPELQMVRVARGVELLVRARRTEARGPVGEGWEPAGRTPDRPGFHDPIGGPMNTRTIAIIALIIAVIVLIVLLT